MIYVTRAEYKSRYQIWVEFNDGTAGVADLEDVLWGPIFEPLRNTENFQRFTVSDVFQTIVWESGADIAPEALYQKVVSQKNLSAKTRSPLT